VPDRYALPSQYQRLLSARRPRYWRLLFAGGVLVLAGLLHLFTGRYEVLSITAIHDVPLFDPDSEPRDDWPHARLLAVLPPGEVAHVERCRTWHGAVVLEVDYHGWPAIVGNDTSSFELHRRRAVVRQPRYATASCLGFFCDLTKCL